MIIGEILGVTRTLSLLENIKGGYAPAMQRTVAQLAIMLRDHVSEDKLTGQVLHVRSGNLRRSITSRTTSNAGQFTGIVGTNCVYARIQEFGGVTKPHDILPRHAKALMFQSAGFVGPMQLLKNVNGRYAKSAKGKITAALTEGSLSFFRGVHHPGSHMPERSFIRSALDDKRAEISAALETAVKEASK